MPEVLFSLGATELSGEAAKASREAALLALTLLVKISGIQNSKVSSSVSRSKRIFFLSSLGACSQVVTPKRRPCRLQTADRADHVDCADLVLFFLFSFLHLLLTRIFFHSGHKLVLNYISECLFMKRPCYVTLAWYVTVDVLDFARETPFSPKYAQISLF